MKKTAFIAIAVVAATFFAGCKPSATKSDSNDTDSTSNMSYQDKQEKDTTIYGECVDGGHGSLVLKCDDDSVREFIIDLDNDSNVVFGGIGNQGDQMAVTFRVNDFKERIVTKAINLTTLQATWASLDRNFEIEKGGAVKSHQQGETRPWTSWRILNGHLLLNSDTFDIDLLNGDSLVLEDSHGVYGYSRK